VNSYYAKDKNSSNKKVCYLSEQAKLKERAKLLEKFFKKFPELRKKMMRKSINFLMANINKYDNSNNL
jgi:hypothetical protein